MNDTTWLRERAKQLRKLADTLEQAAVGLEEIGHSPSSGLDSQPRRRTLDITHASSRDLCFAVLREAGQPMTKRQIMERLQAANRTVTDGTLQSYLSRDKRLMSLGRGVWSLRPATPIGVPIAANGGG